MAVEQVRTTLRERRVTGRRVDAVRVWLGRFSLDGTGNGSRNENRKGRRRFVSRPSRHASRP